MGIKMFDGLLEFLSQLPREIYIFVISMLPIIELRGAIPIGAVLEAPFYLNYLIAVMGNMLPIPFILIFIPRFLSFLERFKTFRPMVKWLRGKATKHSKRVIGEECEQQTENTEDGEVLVNASDLERMTPAIFIGLMLFVALPIPGTGAWSGSLVAALFNFEKKRAFLAILLGVLICGVIMTLASYGVIGFLSFLT